LLSIENTDESDKTDKRIEETGNLFAELMDVLERKDIVRIFSLDISKLTENQL